MRRLFCRCSKYTSLPLSALYIATFHCTYSVDFVLDGVVGSLKMLGDPVDRPLIFQANYNFVTFFSDEVFIFLCSVFQLELLIVMIPLEESFKYGVTKTELYCLYSRLFAVYNYITHIKTIFHNQCKNAIGIGYILYRRLESM